jgi:heme-degrading monooxygenase HmoA
MMIVLFRSRLTDEAGEEYSQTAQRLEELAATMPGFVSFKTFAASDGERVSIVEFESEDAITAWYRHPEHLAAQRRGRESFYEEYRIQVCSPVREYGFTRKPSA